MYIAGSFHTVRRTACGGGTGWIDNDPHFWTEPPTWGICRNDLRRKADSGDYIFFVLPKNARHPQCFFGYLRICKIITHQDAFNRKQLRSKRMGNKFPNGNIIVDAAGKYNRFDGGVHRHIFERVKLDYAIGDPKHSRLLTEAEINKLAPDFMSFLIRLFRKPGMRPIDVITRYGAKLSEAQVDAVLDWIDG